MIWFLYIVRCKDRSFYTGITPNIKNRLKKHRSGKGSKYLRSKLPIRLVYQETHRTKSRALKRESEIKSWTRQEKILFIKKNSRNKS